VDRADPESAGTIEIQGARYSEEAQRMIDR
jgi:hypothetical protein